jgi:MscS family membrane protein
MLHPVLDMNWLSDLHWLDLEFGQNSVAEYIRVLLILLSLVFLRRFVSVLLSRLLFKLIRKRPQSTAVRTFESLLSKPLEWLLTLSVVYFSLIQLDIPQVWNLESVEKPGILMALSKGYKLTLVAAFTFLVLRFIDFFAVEFLDRYEEKEGLIDKQLLPFVKELLKIFIVIVAFFFSLGFVFELNIGNIIAGLGLGGLAFALAAKESLENLFASFTIFLDKPFVVGDLVTVNNITGTIERVGFRSTRIRTLEKSYLTLPNKVMIDNALDNLSLRTHRRADFLLALEYDTPKEKLESFMNRIRLVLDLHEKCSKEETVVRFVEFGESSLNVRVVYYALTQEFVEFHRIREEVNLRILELAREEGVQFAFPNQTVWLRNPAFKT